MVWNFQTSIKSTADSSREILPSEIAILFLADFIGLLSLIISPNSMLQPLPMGIEKLGESNWDYSRFRGTRWELDSNHWDEHFLLKCQWQFFGFVFTFILISLIIQQQCNTHTHTHTHAHFDFKVNLSLRLKNQLLVKTLHEGDEILCFLTTNPCSFLHMFYWKISKTFYCLHCQQYWHVSKPSLL